MLGLEIQNGTRENIVKEGTLLSLEIEGPKVWLNFDVGNISWHVGFLFTLGSVVWCINGCFVFLPELHPSLASNADAIGWTAFVGGTVFIFGAYAAYLEAVNRGHTADFGRAVDAKEHFSEKQSDGRITHHFHTRDVGIHHRKQHLFLRDAHKALQKEPDSFHWAWLGFRFREIGFDATCVQMAAATIFWIAVVTGIPGVLPQLEGALANGVYWLPQVIGGSGFIISSLVFMLETQKHWWKPEPFKLGWHVGFFNLLGGTGFCVSGALGFATSSSGAVYESALWTFLGSWSFLLGSYLQWFE